MIARLALIAVAIAAVPAHADSAEDKVRARAHYKQGKAFLDSGLYDDAIREFKQAYELAPLPELLFNIAQAYRLKDDPDKALEMYQKFLDEVPDGPGSDESRAHVATLTKRIRERDAAKPPEPAPIVPPSDVEPEPREDMRAHRAKQRRLGKIAVIGGAGLELVAIGFFYAGYDLNNQVRGRLFKSADDLRNAESLGSAYNWVGGLSAGLGLAGAGIGFVLIRNNPDVDLQVVAKPSGDVKGVFLVGHL